MGRHEITLEVPGGYGQKESYSVGPRPGSRSKKITHLRVTHKLELHGSIEDGIAQIRALCEGLIEPSFGTVYEGHYDSDDSEHSAVMGWREMTERELAIYADQQATIDRQAQEWERRQFEQLKRTHPEWIREDLEAP